MAGIWFNLSEVKTKWLTLIPQTTFSNAFSLLKIFEFRIQFDSLLWRHNGHNSVSNHQPYDCLLSRLFRRRSKQTSKLRVTGLCAGNSPGPVNFPHKWPVTRKMFPFDDVIMLRFVPKGPIDNKPLSEPMMVLDHWRVYVQLVGGIIYVFLELLRAFSRRLFWFNPNMQNSALWTTLAFPSPDTARITLTTFWS